MNQTINDPRTQQILSGRPMPILFRMATPNVLAFLIQAAVNMTEIWYVGQLGTTALAAMAFIFPSLMLMQMLSNGALGGAVASATARALGSGDVKRARRLVWHALFIAGCASLLFMSIYFLFGESLLMFVGAQGTVLEQTLGYGGVLFGGCASIWLMSLLSGLFRGMGEMRFQARLLAAGSLVQVVLSGTLVLGWFGAPQLGIQGAAVSVICIASASTLILLYRLLSGRIAVKLEWVSARLEFDLFIDIFRVGALASISPFLTVTTIMVVNRLLSSFGEAMVAGYGIGSRLEFLLIPVVVGFGTAMNTMVGMNVGSGNIKRAEHIAFVGGCAAAAIAGSVGLTLAIFPDAWIGLFTEDPHTLAAGARYLRITGWAFTFQGMGLALYFASQGAGTVVWPVASNIARFAISVGCSTLAVSVFDLSVNWMFACIALGMTVYGLGTAASIWLGAWRRS